MHMCINGQSIRACLSRLLVSTVTNVIMSEHGSVVRMMHSNPEPQFPRCNGQDLIRPESQSLPRRVAV